MTFVIGKMKLVSFSLFLDAPPPPPRPRMPFTYVVNVYSDMSLSNSFKSIVRLHLEYASTVWFPVFKKDKVTIENVQRRAKKLVMLRLHYVAGGHGSHDFGHRGRNGVTVTQRRGTGSTNVARRGCRDHRDRFLNSQKNCHGSHGGIDLLKVPQ